jgi:hypothetical protein
MEQRFLGICGLAAGMLDQNASWVLGSDDDADFAKLPDPDESWDEVKNEW